jgi:hypothetical protein
MKMKITYICFECDCIIKNKAYWVGGNYSGYICEDCYNDKY